MLGGCPGFSGKADLNVDLPPPPGYMAPVAVPQPKGGEDLFTAYAMQGKALDGANGRLVNSRAWYTCQRSSFAAGKAVQCP